MAQSSILKVLEDLKTTMSDKDYKDAIEELGELRKANGIGITKTPYMVTTKLLTIMPHYTFDSEDDEHTIRNKIVVTSPRDLIISLTETLYEHIKTNQDLINDPLDTIEDLELTGVDYKDVKLVKNLLLKGTYAPFTICAESHIKLFNIPRVIVTNIKPTIIPMGATTPYFTN